MKMIFFSLFLTFASQAHAHIEPGTHTGVTPEGTPCTMIAGETYFENNLRHPLTERISISIDGLTYIVGHPSVIDSSTGQVSFNHDLFRGVLPLPTGAAAVEIEMVHSDQSEGPRSFVVMNDNWKTQSRKVLRCQNLSHTK